MSRPPRKLHLAGHEAHPRASGNHGADRTLCNHPRSGRGTVLVVSDPEDATCRRCLWRRRLGTLLVLGIVGIGVAVAQGWVSLADLLGSGR